MNREREKITHDQCDSADSSHRNQKLRVRNHHRHMTVRISLNYHDIKLTFIFFFLNVKKLILVFCWSNEAQAEQSQHKLTAVVLQTYYQDSVGSETQGTPHRLPHLAAELQQTVL